MCTSSHFKSAKRYNQNERIRTEEVLANAAKTALSFEQIFSMFFAELTDATLEKQFRYLLSRKSSSCRQARLQCAAFSLPVPICPLNFDSLGSLELQAVASDDLGKIHQPRESPVLIVDVQ